jgi:uncharacterized membrane protein
MNIRRFKTLMEEVWLVSYVGGVMMVIDPVCKMEIEESKAAATAELAVTFDNIVAVLGVIVTP